MISTLNQSQVGVVIPMYNAARTIEETLASVCAQTYRSLDIVVVDDGSTDASADLIKCWPDQRVRLVRQDNAGVAAARNLGALSTTAPFLAFLDADDIWLPTKIEAQMKVMEANPDNLVWCWYDEIDDASNCSCSPDLSSEETLAALCCWNIVGNGSSILVSRRVFVESGGFDTTLRDRDAQGCEDYSFALRVAEKFPMKVIADRLVGYRISVASMSANTQKMWRSHDLVISEFEAKHPQYAQQFLSNRKNALLSYYYRAIQVKDYKSAVLLLLKAIRMEVAQQRMKRNLLKSWIRFRFARFVPSK